MELKLNKSEIEDYISDGLDADGLYPQGGVTVKVDDNGDIVAEVEVQR